jgi:protein TonB
MKRVGAALVASAVVHAAAAAALGGALVAAAARAAHPAMETLDVDLAPMDDEPGSAPAATEMRGAVAPTRGPAVVRRALAARPRASALSAAAIAESTAAQADAGPPARFALSAATVASGPGLAEAAAPGTGQGSPSSGAHVFGAGEVDAPPRLLAAAPVSYPPAARQAELEADVPLELVVDAQGHVVSARVAAKAGFGLDDEALRAIRGYRFSPALRAGLPVAVRTRWLVQFRLQ